MKKETKEAIFFWAFMLLIISGGIIVIYFAMVEPTMTAWAENDKIDKLFRNADFNISDEYVVEFTSHFGADFFGFKDTDWYHWDTLVYIENRPSRQSDITLWLNIETGESYYIGDLP